MPHVLHFIFDIISDNQGRSIFEYSLFGSSPNYILIPSFSVLSQGRYILRLRYYVISVNHALSLH